MKTAQHFDPHSGEEFFLQSLPVSAILSLVVAGKGAIGITVPGGGKCGVMRLLLKKSFGLS